LTILFFSTFRKFSKTLQLYISSALQLPTDINQSLWIYPELLWYNNVFLWWNNVKLDKRMMQ